jgi:hypothetical protein
MKEPTKSGFTTGNKYFLFAFDVLKKNDQFLRENAGDVYKEIVDFANEAVNYLGIFINIPSREEEYVKSSMFYFINHVFVPLSSGIWFDVLSGNLPVCFFEIRSILESLVKCYLADLRYPNESFFQDRLYLLEEEKISNSKWMRELEIQLDLDKAFVTLWGRLSERWVHTKGIMNQFVRQVENQSEAPTWALIIPMKYNEDDLDTLVDLRNYIFKLRKLIQEAMKKYNQRFNFDVFKPPSS